MDWVDVKQRVSMTELLSSYGIEVPSNGRMACPLHGGKNPSFAIHDDAQAWTCHSKCGCSGDIFTFVEKHDGITPIEAKKKIEELFSLSDVPERKMEKKLLHEVVYEYRDADGDVAYEMIRRDFSDGSKSFMPRKNGKFSLPKEERILYNRDLIGKVASLGDGSTEYVIVCEGEKTADAIVKTGFIATTNPFGSGDWQESYAETLKGLNVVVFPDADKQGEKLKKNILSSLNRKAKTVKVISVPNKFVKENPQFHGHDFADMVEIGGEARATAWLADAIADAEEMPDGIDPSVNQTPRTLFRAFKQRIDSGKHTECFNIKEWLPNADYSIYNGDLFVLMANTSVGKSRLLQNIPYNVRHKNFAIFDLELSLEVLTMRYTAMENGLSFSKAMERLSSGLELKEPDMDHVNIQKVQRITVDKIRNRVDEIETITGKRIDIVSVDYIGLMGGSGTVYERTSSNVEEFKAYATETNRVGLLTTQCARKGDDGRYECPSLHDAKNSGSIENSGQEVMAFWLDNYDDSKMFARMLKYSHGEYSHRDIELLANNLVIKEACYG